MMAKRTLWNWLFGLMAKPEPRQPMAVPNSPARGKPMAGAVSLSADEWNELCSRSPRHYDGARAMTDAELRERSHRMAAGVVAGEPQRDVPRKWEPGIEHNQPHPVKENPDGSLYYKGKVYRMVGERRNNKNKRRQG